MRKKSFLMYQSMGDLFNEMSNEQAGLLAKAIFAYVCQDAKKVEELTQDPAVKFSFISIRTNLDRDMEKYSQLCEKNRKNIKKRWDTTVYDPIRPNTTEYDSIPPANSDTIVYDGVPYDTDNDNDTDTDTEKIRILSSDGSEDDHEALPENGTPRCPAKEIVAAYHEILPELPRVKVLTEKRKAWLQARWREDKKRQSVEWWRKYFTYVRQQPHLMGHNDRGWTADFEWLINLSSFTKVYEGKYLPRDKPTRTTGLV